MIDKYVARNLFLTLLPAAVFLLLFLMLSSPWSYIFLGLSVVCCILALQAIRKARYD